jgi:hypothetical protein
MVHPTSSTGASPSSSNTKFDRERSTSIKVVDNDADVVHPLNRHVPEHRLLRDCGRIRLLKRAPQLPLGTGMLTAELDREA